MKIVPFKEFLTTGTAQVTGPFRAIGIHPSSEVDLVDVDGYRLGVGAIVPITSSGASLRAVRRAPDNLVAMSGDAVGQKLVVQLYEACDPLVPPGPRQPTYRDGVVRAADLGVVAGGANLAVRLPMHGRRMACIRFKRIASTQDLTLIVLGVARGDERSANTGYMYTEKASETWFSGGVAPTVTAGELAATLQAATVYVGGFGDGGEHFDELLCYVFGPADAGNDAHVAATAYGEER